MADPRLADRPLTEPHPARLALDHPDRLAILVAHASALRSGEPGYIDPVTGFMVWTAAYLADRRTCCANGCRHCPYVGGPDVPSDGADR
jgi:hypothetical protein